MTAPKPHSAGWYPDPSNPGRQRYFDGIAWTDVAIDDANKPAANGKPDSDGISRATAIAVGVCVLSGIGLVMSMQSTSLLNGTGNIWLGVALTAAGLAIAFFLRAESWVRTVAAVILVIAVFSAGYMEKQLSDKRDEIAHMFGQ